MKRACDLCLNGQGIWCPFPTSLDYRITYLYSVFALSFFFFLFLNENLLTLSSNLKHFD